VGANAIMFNMEGVGLISVAQYYHRTYNYGLQFPDLLCVEIGNGAFVPFELCDVVPGQIMGKELPSDETKDMVGFDQLIPQYLFSLQGFTTQSIPAIKEAILRVWDKAKFKNNIAELIADNESFIHFSTPDATNYIVSTFRVIILDTKVRGGKPNPTINIYMESPTNDPEAWVEWRDHLADLHYPSPRQPLLRVIPGWNCGTECHANDHPRATNIKSNLSPP